MAVDKTLPILIVDDYRTMIRIIRNLLTLLGFEDVEDAQDGRAALAKLKQRSFGLVISDWNMEPMSGLDLLRAVRADPALQASAVHHDHRRRPRRAHRAGTRGRCQRLCGQALQCRDAGQRIASAIGA